MEVPHLAIMFCCMKYDCFCVLSGNLNESDTLIAVSAFYDKQFSKLDEPTELKCTYCYGINSNVHAFYDLSDIKALVALINKLLI